MGSFKAWTVPAEDVMIMHAVKVCGQEWKKSCSTAVGTNRRNTLWESWRLWSGDIIWVTGLTEESAPPTVGCLRQFEESSTMIISFSLHNSCSNKMCQVILTKPLHVSVWVEISTLRWEIRMLWSRSTWACELKFRKTRQAERHDVTLHVSVWVEIYQLVRNVPWVIGHAPRERVSWNDSGDHCVGYLIRSRSTWACELKFSDAVPLSPIRTVTLHVSVWVEIFRFSRERFLFSSRSTWACELKLRNPRNPWQKKKSRSTWACELKCIFDFIKSKSLPSRSTWACELKLRLIPIRRYK